MLQARTLQLGGDPAKCGVIWELPKIRGTLSWDPYTVHGSNFGVRRATLKPELEHGNQIWSQGWEHKAAQQVI